MPANRDLPGAVLFACTQNSVRSPMAAAIFRHLAGARSYVQSAGVRAGETDAFAVAVMAEIGIDLSSHKPHAFGALYDGSFDLVVTLSPEAHHQALMLGRVSAFEVEYWPTADATAVRDAGGREQVLTAYRAVREQLFARIKARFGLGGGPAV